MNQKENQLNNILQALNTVCAMKEDYLSLLQQLAENNPSKLKNTQENLTFTQKEIDKMPKAFKREFRAEGCTIRISRRKVSKNGYTYERCKV